MIGLIFCNGREAGHLAVTNNAVYLLSDYRQSILTFLELSQSISRPDKISQNIFLLSRRLSASATVFVESQRNGRFFLFYSPSGNKLCVSYHLHTQR